MVDDLCEHVLYEAKDGSIITRGIKWIIDKIRRLIQVIRNLWSRSKPSIDNQIKSIRARQEIIQSAFSASGVPIPKSEPAHSKTATSSPSSMSLSSVEKLGEKARASKNLKMSLGDGTKVNFLGNDTFIIIGERMLCFEKYLEKIQKILVPAIKDGFQNQALIQKVKNTFGDDGNIAEYYTPGNKLDYDWLYQQANRTIIYLNDLMNSPEVKRLENQSNVDPYLPVIMNGVFIAINACNMAMKAAHDLINVTYNNPFNNEDLKRIKDRRTLGKITEHLISSSKSLGGYTLVKPLIASTCKAKGWIENPSTQTPAGATRIVVLTTDKDPYVYKYAWNKKGIIDNKRDLAIKEKFVFSDLAKKFALPTDESSKSGAYIVVQRADPAPAGIAPEFFANLRKDLSKAEIKVGVADTHNNNIGMINGQPVVIDYGNFAVY